MADWPRAIKPEDRVKYLIQARADLSIEWDEYGLAGVEDEERVWIDIDLGREEDTFRAMYATDRSPEILIGEFSSPKEAKKALHDHLVLQRAVAQAWEDVAS